jgi:hypothetical protein
VAQEIISSGKRYLVLTCRAETGSGKCPATIKAIELAPPSKIERPMYTPEGREDPELREFLRPPALPWERNGAR